MVTDLTATPYTNHASIEIQVSLTIGLTYNIQKVRVDIIKNEEIVAFMLFNGSNTNNKNWFTHGNLLNSSWQDLITMTPTQNSHFDLIGIGMESIKVTYALW